jgi:tetratricopeptide (TPR) repeat protein
MLTSVADDGRLSQQARERIKQGNFEEGGALLDELIAEQEAQVTDLARNHFNRAELYMLQFDPISALPHYRKAHRYAPENPEYSFALAVTLQKQKSFTEAERVYRQLLDREQTKSERATTLNNLANLYRETQRFGEGESAYREALEIRRRLAEANPAVFGDRLAQNLIDLSLLYFKTKKNASACALLAEAEEVTRTDELKKRVVSFHGRLCSAPGEE